MATLTCINGQWKPQTSKNQTVYEYLAEYSRSGKSRCRKCSEYIPNKSIRFAIPIRDPRGEFGYISAWQHLECSRVEVPATATAAAASEEKEENQNQNQNQNQNNNNNNTARTFLASRIYGLTSMEEADQTKILDEIMKTEKPAHLQELNPDDLVKRPPLPQVEPPADIHQHLLPFQKESFGWMCQQEQGEFKGGIIADEMGMGKTIVSVSLIVARQSVTPTLVVCPVSSMMQWQEEIQNHVTPGLLNVVVYSKNSKTVKKDDLLVADVVLTTYPTLEIAWRKLVDDIKVKCKHCSKSFVPKKLEIHNKYFCGPNAQKTTKQQKQEKSGSSTTITDADNEDSSASGGNAASSSSSTKTKRNNKIQSAATIKKGLRTLEVEIDDDDEDEEENQNQNQNTSSSKKNKKNLKSNNNSNKNKNENDQDEEEDDDDKLLISSSTNTENKSIAGPMGMYAELMQEAGRKVRNRWDRSRRVGEASSSSSSESSDENDDEEDSDDDETFSDESSSSSSSEDEEEKIPKSKNNKNKKISVSDAKKKNENTNANNQNVTCTDCNFKVFRFKFCPKTGKPHPKKKSKAELAREQSGQELKPLPDDEDAGADDVNRDNSLLHAIKWHRVILDEAHRIKGRSTSTARSAFALHGTHKWCLTGTPLQNRVGDLYSLLRFLRMAPYARYYCSVAGCKCSTLSHPFTSDITSNFCAYCGHGPLQHYSHFNRHILNPITRYGYVGDGRRAMLVLSRNVLQHIMLRRTKAERAADMRLPPLNIHIEYIDLSDAERDFYESLYKKSSAKFDTFVTKGTLLHNYAHIFQLLSRLRQALDHPYLVLFGNTGGVFNNTNTANASSANAIANNAQTATAGGGNIVVENQNQNQNQNVAFYSSPTTTSTENNSINNNLFTSSASQMGLTLDNLPAAANKTLGGESEVCGICQESTRSHASRVVVKPCNHTFHVMCLREYVESCPKFSELLGGGNEKDENKKNNNKSVTQQQQNQNQNQQQEEEKFDEDTPLILAAVAAANKKKPATKKSSKKKDKEQQENDDDAVGCPRCFVPIHVDLQRLAALGDEASSSSSSSSDDDDNVFDENEKNGTTLVKKNSKNQNRFDNDNTPKERQAKRRERKDETSSSSSSNNKRSSRKQQQQQQQEEENDEEETSGMFSMTDFAAVQAPGGEDNDNDDNDEKVQEDKNAAAAAQKTKLPKSSSSSSNNILRRIDTSRFVEGTKITAIVNTVKKITEEKKEKTIIFSQFGTMLDLLEFALERAKIRCVKLTGALPLAARLTVLRAFRTDPEIPVILISLKAGGEGLNLQVANNVIVADVWWSVGPELQAIQRCHRIGQDKPVNAIRFVTRRSVEERMISLQQKKMLVFEGTVDGKFDSLQRLNEEDLRFLFTK